MHVAACTDGGTRAQSRTQADTQRAAPACQVFNGAVAARVLFDGQPVAPQPLPKEPAAAAALVKTAFTYNPLFVRVSMKAGGRGAAGGWGGGGAGAWLLS